MAPRSRAAASYTGHFFANSGGSARCGSPPRTSTADQVRDFSSDAGDRINLEFVDANSGEAGDQAFTFIGTDAFHDVAGELRCQQIYVTTYVYGDLDGDGNADLLIKLVGTHALTSGDFVL